MKNEYGMYNKECTFCKRYFESFAPNARYCSIYCANQARKERRTSLIQLTMFQTMCTNCTKWFFKTRKAHKFCCVSCRSSFHQQQKRLAKKETIQ